MYVMCYLSRQYSKNYKPFLDDEKPEKIILTEVTCEKIPKMRRSEINATSGEITIGNTQEITDKEKLHNTIQKIFYSMSEKDIIFFFKVKGYQDIVQRLKEDSSRVVVLLTYWSLVRTNI